MKYLMIRKLPHVLQMMVGSGQEMLALASEDELPAAELREHLAKEQPSYMIPSYFLHLNSMPVTANGKINMKAIPKPENRINAGVEYNGPENEIEEKLVEIWRKVLGICTLGINDNFFDVGGNSILMMKMGLEMEKNGFAIKRMDIYKYKTVQGTGTIYKEPINEQLYFF